MAQNKNLNNNINRALFMDEIDPSTSFIIPSPITKEEAEYLIEKKLKATGKKYSNTNEEITLRTYGIKINGDCISKGELKNKKVFNAAEKALIYFLYFKFRNNKEECFKMEALEKEINYPKGYLKNRITNIHKILGKAVSKDRPVKITFIKNEPRRGYHLNPKLFV